METETLQWSDLKGCFSFTAFSNTVERLRELLHRVTTITNEQQTHALTFKKYNLNSTKLTPRTWRKNGFTLNEME